MPAAVRRIPLAEKMDFWWHIARRYYGQLLFYWGTALRRTWSMDYGRQVSDSRFGELLWDTSMSRLLVATLDPIDEARFAADVRPGARYAKLDCSLFAELPALPGTFVAPTVSLFDCSEGQPPRVLAIAVGELVLRPGDGDAWERAKQFALMGAGIHMVTCHHIPLHFPQDTVNAVSKALLPRGHIVRELVEPHFRFSLSLNNAALHSPMSVLQNEPYFTYSPFPLAAAHVFRMTRAGYGGVAGNSGYPAWRFHDGPDPVLGDYGVFLKAYYDAMLPLGRAVAARIPANDAAFDAWATAIGGFLPGFPSADALRDRELAGRVLTRIIWSASVGHAADHHDYGKIPIDEIPFRLRVPPPQRRDEAAPPLPRVRRRADAFRHEMARAMFFQEVTIVPLPSVRYAFAAPELQGEARAMIARLHETDRTLPVRRFVPLDKIPASVQF
jgi:hypothetical protein